MTMMATTPTDEVEELDSHRGYLIHNCRRMLGTTADAEDAAQETIVRAWRNLHRFERRASMRTWLHRISTNVCLDMLTKPAVRLDDIDRCDGSPDGDPAESVAAHDRVRQAFVAAVLHLPAKQRAVLILRDVLRWRASEVAELLGSSVQAVNSALQRARTTMASCDPDAAYDDSLDDQQRTHVARCAEAFANYDVAALVSLISRAGHT